MGSWVVYGLGTENQDLPGFITIKPTLSHGGAKNWSSAFLPGAYQGTAIGHSGMKVEDIPARADRVPLNQGLTPEEQRFELDMLQNINRRHPACAEHDPQLEARIEAFELAFRMQVEAPEAFEVEKESEATKKLYGSTTPSRATSPGSAFWRAGSPSAACATSSARTATSGTSTATSTREAHRERAEVDKPIAGLLKDLKRSAGLVVFQTRGFSCRWQYRRSRNVAEPCATPFWGQPSLMREETTRRSEQSARAEGAERTARSVPGRRL
jgi:hypothetical protein